MASRYTRRLTTIRFEGANGSGLTVAASPRDLTQGDTNAENAEHIKVMDGGQHDGFVLGDDLVQAMTITIEEKNEAQTHATAARIRDFLQHTGSFAIGGANEATSVDDTIWAWKTITTHNDGTTTSTKTYPVCEGAHSFNVLKESNTIVVSFNNHGTIAVT